MRWEITKRAWELAKRQFPEAGSLYISLPVRFKMSGAIPVHDLKSKSEIGSISYKVTPYQAETTLVLQCKDEQLAYVLPPPRMMTFSVSKGKAEIKGSGICAKEIMAANPDDKEVKIAALAAAEIDELSPENVRKWLSDNEFPAEVYDDVCDAAASIFGQPKPPSFNYKMAKSKTQRNVKDFPATVHVVQDGNAMVVADVFQVRRVRHKNKQYEWWQVRPAGSSKAFWVLSDFIRPIMAGTVVAATSPANQLPRSIEPASSFKTDDLIWLRDKKGHLFGPMYVTEKRIGKVKLVPSHHGISMFPGMQGNFGNFRAKFDQDEWIDLKDYEVMIGEWRAKTFGDLEVGDEFMVAGLDWTMRKKDASAATVLKPEGEDEREFGALDIVHGRDNSFGLIRFDPWRQITGPGNEEALLEAQRILAPGTAVTLDKRGDETLQTMGTFEKWEETPNRLNPSKKGSKAMVIRIDDSGAVIKVVPSSEQRQWDVKVYGATTLDEAVSQGHAWATCDDPIMDDPIVRGNLINRRPGVTEEVPEKLVAVLSIEGDVVLIRAGDVLIKVPKSSLKPAFRSDKGLPWVNMMLMRQHPYVEGDVLLRDNQRYVVEHHPTDEKLNEAYVAKMGSFIPVTNELGKETLIPNDRKNKYIGVSMGGGEVAAPMSLKSKVLQPKEEEEPRVPEPPPPFIPMPSMPSAPPPPAPEI